MTEEGRAPGDEPSPLAEWGLLTHDRQLGERLFLQTYVRLVIAFTLVAGALVGRYLVGVELDVPALVLLGVAVGAYNAAAWWITRKHRRPWETPEVRRRLHALMCGAILCDYAALSVAIWLVGGTRSPFLPFYLLHVILCCLLLSRRAAILFHFLAYGFLAALVTGEWTGIIPPRQPAGAVGGAGPLDGRHALTVLVVYGVLFLVTAYLLLGFARMIRRSERRILQANTELVRLSAMRRDFLSIAVDNLESPVGVAITLLRNLAAGLGGSLTGKQADWIGRCLDRLGGLTPFMRNLQMLSSLEVERLDAPRKDVDLAAMLARIMEEHLPAADSRGQVVFLHLPEHLPAVRGVEALLREAVVHYVTNAIRYSPEGGRITIRAVHAPPSVRIEVEDDGPGIPESDRQRLFTEFYRGRAKGSPARVTGGSGLGLSIVRRVAEHHGGRAFVESRAGKGSRFAIELPVPVRGDG